MSALQANPFNKQNPFQVGHFERFKHPYISHPKSNQYSHLVYHESFHPKQTQMNDNNWAFNQNNLSRKLDFARKYESQHNQVSEFQVRMKMSSVYALPNQNQNQRSFDVKDGKMENPFLRKNLLINKEEVANQVQMDLNLYKNKVSSVYQKAPRVSFGRESNDQSPPFRPSKASSSNRQSVPTPQNMKISQYIREQPMDSKDPLSYSKTPQITERLLNPFKEEDESVPNEIKFRKKTFFLNYVNLN